jgi:hypothetical protein
MVILFALFSLLISSCSDPIGVGKATENIEQAIDRAIFGLGGSVDDVNSTLKELERNLIAVIDDLPEELEDSIREMLRKEVRDTIDYTAASVGAEFRCDFDFLIMRIKESLQHLGRSLVNSLRKLAQLDPLPEKPPPQPEFCNVIPDSIDMADKPESRKKIVIVGYNFPLDPQDTSIRVYHKRLDGTQEDVTEKLGSTTHYKMVLNLGPSGVELTDQSDKLEIGWEGEKISTVWMIHETTPLCGTRTDPFTPDDHTFIPDIHLENDDLDFRKRGPKIQATVIYNQPQNRELSILVHMHASEYLTAEQLREWNTLRPADEVDKDDKLSAFWGMKKIKVYTPPDGWEIDSVSGIDDPSPRTFIDDDYERTPISQAKGPVKKWSFVGDTPGKDFSETRVDIKFREISIRLREVGNHCVPVGVAQKLEVGSVSEATRLRFSNLLRSQGIPRIQNYPHTIPSTTGSP